jgi:hypothetical protein
LPPVDLRAVCFVRAMCTMWCPNEQWWCFSSLGLLLRASSQSQPISGGHLLVTWLFRPKFSCFTPLVLVFLNPIFYIFAYNLKTVESFDLQFSWAKSTGVFLSDTVWTEEISKTEGVLKCGQLGCELENFGLFLYIFFII